MLHVVIDIQAICPGSLRNLEDYLATFVSEVVKCWEKHQGSNVEEIFEMIKDNYKEYSDIRSAKKQANPGELLEELRARACLKNILNCLF